MAAIHAARTAINTVRIFRIGYCERAKHHDFRQGAELLSPEFAASCSFGRSDRGVLANLTGYEKHVAMAVSFCSTTIGFVGLLKLIAKPINLRTKLLKQSTLETVRIPDQGNFSHRFFT